MHQNSEENFSSSSSSSSNHIPKKINHSPFPTSSIAAFYERSSMFEMLQSDDIPLHYLRSGMRLVFTYNLTFTEDADYAGMYVLTHSADKHGAEEIYFIDDNRDLEAQIKEALHVAGLFVNYTSISKDVTTRVFRLALDFSVSLSARQSLGLGLRNLEPESLECRKGRTWWDRLPEEDEGKLRDMQAVLCKPVVRHMFRKTGTVSVLMSRGKIRYFFFRNK